MFYLPHTPPTPPQLIYFPFLISLFIFNFPPQFFYSLLHNFIIFPPHSWIPSFSTILSFYHFSSSSAFLLFSLHHHHHHHHISIVFPPLPPPPPTPPPHFYCFSSTTTTTTTATFLLFLLHHHHHHHHISIVFPPPPHFYCFHSSYCFPAVNVIWEWPFRPDFGYFGLSGRKTIEGVKTIEMWWWWRKKVDSGIHRINLISIQWITQLVPLTLIYWIVIYPVENAIQLLNDWGQVLWPTNS